VFEGVDWTAEVWLNGKKLGSHTAYCEPFRFDVTSLLENENKLAVRVSEGSWFNEPSAGWAVFPMPTCPPPKARIVRDRSKSLEGYQRGDPHLGSGYGTVDVPTWNPHKVKDVDLSSLAKAPVASVSLELMDSKGNGLCTYAQEFHLRAYHDLFWPEGEGFRRNEQRRRSNAWAEARKKHGASATIEDAKQAYRELYRQESRGNAGK